MAIIPLRTAGVNEIIRRFDAVAYPRVAIETVEEEPSESDRKLVERTFRVPKVLQVKIYDYAPNISRWILSTGFFGKLPKDSTTQGAIEESAANRLKQLRVVQFAGIPAPQRLMDHVFETVASSYGENRSKFIDRVIERSPGHFFWKAFLKIRSFIDRYQWVIHPLLIGIMAITYSMAATLLSFVCSTYLVLVPLVKALVAVGLITLPLGAIGAIVGIWLCWMLLWALFMHISNILTAELVSWAETNLPVIVAAQKEKLARQVWTQLPPYRAEGNVT